MHYIIALVTFDLKVINLLKNWFTILNRFI